MLTDCNESIAFVKVAVNRKLQKFIRGLSILYLYIEESTISFATYNNYYIVEQASCYYHSKFHGDTVFLHKDTAPNKYNIWIISRVRFSKTLANIALDISVFDKVLWRRKVLTDPVV